MMIEDRALYGFVERVVDALPDHVGPLVGHWPRPVLFAASQEAVTRAERYNLQTERELFHYVQLAVMLGGAFDTDPGLPWARDILRDNSYLDGAEKLDDLWNTAMDYLDEVFGTEAGCFSATAFDAYRARRPLPDAIGGSNAAALDDLKTIWPAKAALLPFDVLKAGVAAASDRAAAWELDQTAQWRFCRIGFLLGYAFDADPLHDWAAQALSGSGSSADRMARVEAAFETSVIDPALDALATEQEKEG